MCCFDRMRCAVSPACGNALRNLLTHFTSMQLLQKWIFWSFGLHAAGFFFWSLLSPTIPILINLSSDTFFFSVSSLKQAIERKTKVPANSLVLLVSGGEVLQSDHMVSSYSAGTDTNPIYMFSKPSVKESHLKQSSKSCNWLSTMQLKFSHYVQTSTATNPKNLKFSRSNMITLHDSSSIVIKLKID